MARTDPTLWYSQELSFREVAPEKITQLGKPMENGHIESFNGRLRDECLNVNQFHSLDHARQLLDAWRLDYNHCRPHRSLAARGESRG